jgi:hypothetical protein
LCGKGIFNEKGSNAGEPRSVGEENGLLECFDARSEVLMFGREALS